MIRARGIGVVAGLIAATIVLSACASRHAETPGQKLFAVQSEFNTILTVAKSYMELPNCTPGVVTACGSTDVKQRIVSLVTEAHGAIQAARGALNSTAGGSSVAVAAGVVRRLITYLVTKEIVKHERKVTYGHSPPGRSIGGRAAARAGGQSTLRRIFGEGQADGRRGPRPDARGMGRA